MKHPHEKLRALLQLVLATDDLELNCEQFIDRAAAYLECIERSGALPPELAPVKQHLGVCSECEELFQALWEGTRDGEPSVKETR